MYLFVSTNGAKSKLDKNWATHVKLDSSHDYPRGLTIVRPYGLYVDFQLYVGSQKLFIFETMLINILMFILLY